MAEEARPLDRDRLKAFTQRMVGHLEGAAVTLMIEVGRRVGLFEAMAGQGAATTDAIASRAGLHERYVREWLGAMVCGGIVDYDPAARTYRLPPEHAASLTGSSSRNLTTIAEFLPLTVRVIPDVVEAFRSGQGVPYSAYQPDFTGLMDRRSRPRYEECLFTKYLPSVEGLVAGLESGLRVADVGCGTGYCVNLMAKRFPRSTFIGYDASEPAIAHAREEAAAMGVTNATFVVADVARLAVSAPFDLVTAFDAIHDQARPAAVLARVRESLTRGGVFVMLEPSASSELQENVGLPMAAYVYTISTMHCMAVGLHGGGAGLGTAWGHQVATRMLHEAGFANVRRIERVDPVNTLYVAHI